MAALFYHPAYWCHSCDMSIALPPSPTPNSLLCPHCHFDSLEQLDDDDVVSNPLSTAAAPKSSIDSLPEIVVKVDDDDDSDVICPVCKDQFVIESVAKVMPCLHRFHSECIVPWLEINNSCPVCRFKLPVVVEENNIRNRVASVEFPLVYDVESGSEESDGRGDFLEEDQDDWELDFFRDEHLRTRW